MKVGGLSAFMVMIAMASSSCFAAPLPGGVTPGGAMPRLKQFDEPFVYPNVVAPEDRKAPAIIDDPDAPRMLLRGFDLRGIKDHKELGITTESIRQLISRQTATMVPEGAPRLFTLGMFEEIANAITRYYRQRGFFLARAYIPEQKVKDGIVRLNIVETYLDQIIFDGNKLYKDATMQVLFEDLIGKPVFKQSIENALYKLNDYPGLTATSIFGPGTQPGSAAMVIRTQEQASYDMVSMDNYGSAYTGENRLSYRHRSNNLFGQADQLSFNLMTSFLPTNNQYADVTYVQPVFKSLFKVGGGVKANLFKVGEELEDLNINGQSLIVNGFIDFPLLVSRNDRFSLVTDLSLKSATSKIVDTVAAKDKLTVLRLDAFYSGIDRWLWPASHEASFSYSQGFADLLGAMDANGSGLSGRRGGSGKRAGGDFSKINFSYSRLQPTFDLQSFMFRLQAQFSSDLLTSLEQFSLGGAYSVRAYPAAEVLVDNAVFTSFEYIVNASPEVKQTWLNKLQLSVYFDYAQGDLNDPLVNEASSATLSGLGLGIQVEPFNLLRARIDLATATGDKPSDLQTLPFYFSLEYRF